MMKKNRQMEGELLMERIIEPKVQIPKARQIFSNNELKKLIVPLLIEQFLMLLVGMIDTLMVSYAGEAAVSGVSLVAQVNLIFIAVFTALASGGAVVISQYIGRKDKKNTVLSAGQLIMVSIIISTIITGLILIFRIPILGFLFGKVESDVMQASQKYLFITALSFPALAVYSACSSILRSMSKTNVTMYVSIIMNAINIIGNYIGIFVLKAGVAGVAVPSLISRVVAAIIMFVYCLNKDNLVYIKIKDMFRYEKSMVKKIVNIAIPNGIEGGMLNASKVALSSIVAMFGTYQIAANGIAQTFWGLSALFTIVMGPVYITVIGQCIGGDDYDAAKYYVNKLTRITMIGCLIWNIVVLLSVPYALKLYNLSPKTVELVILLCLIHNAACAFLHPFGFVLAFALRAAGDVKYTMYTSVFATVIVRVALAYLFGVVFNMGVIGVAFAMVCDWIVRIILIATRYKSEKWKEFQVI